MLGRIDTIFQSFLFAVCFIGLTAASFAQNLQKKPEPSTCEYLKHALDYSLIETEKIDDQHLILIFSPSQNEKSTSLVISRKEFIVKYLNFRDPKFTKLVVAQADSTKGLGTMKIFVAGQLAWEILFKKDAKGWNSCTE